jgi:carboxymethylenebutenolidase
MQTEVTLNGAGGVQFPGVLTVPDAPSDAGPTRGPALVLIYEVFGMTEEMKRVARDLAAEGYVVLIPDLFAAAGPKPLCVMRTMRTMMRGEGKALHDLENARRWLVTRPEVDADRIGAIGFCMGGSFALLLARTGLYKVSAPFYPQAVDLPQACPVVASFGGRDRTTVKFADTLTTRLDELGQPHDVQVYPEAGHSFYTRTDGLMGRLGPHLPLRAEYHEPSARDAHRRILAFFREHLDPTP